MEQFETIASLRRFIGEAKRAGKRVSFVPTMGALHDGHRSCIDIARGHGDVLVVSLFVNPTQFGANEDLERYPADLGRDLELCRLWGCDVTFAPAAAEIYPEEQSTWIDVGAVAAPLCGRSRPGHFRGVATVVAKLFAIVLPDVAVFGQKDAQQALVIREMVRQLNFPVELRLSPIVREADGLALSSRNAYLSAAERRRAVGLSQGLEAGLREMEGGERTPATVTDVARRAMASAGIDSIEYVELLDASTLQEVPAARERMILAGAVHVGSTRLIDNRVFEIDPAGGVEQVLLF